MIVDSSLQIRRTAIAYLHPPISGAANQRQDNLQFYDKIHAAGLDFPEMQHGSELVLLNRGPGAERITEIRVGNFSLAQGVPLPPGVQVPAHFRVLFAEQASPKPFKFTTDAADAMFEAARQVWGARLGAVSLVEVSIVATTQINYAQGSGAYLRDRVTRVGDSGPASRLGRAFDQVTVKLASGPPIVVGESPQQPPLPGAHVECTFEPVAEDQKLVVITLLVRWPALQLRLRDLQLPPEVREMLGGRDFLELNQDVKVPTHYIDQVYKFLQDNVLSFLDAVGR